MQKLFKGNSEVRFVGILMVAGKCSVLMHTWAHCIHGVFMSIGNSAEWEWADSKRYSARENKLGSGIGTAIERTEKQHSTGPTRKRLFYMSISLSRYMRVCCVCVGGGGGHSFASVDSLRNLCNFIWSEKRPTSCVVLVHSTSNAMRITIRLTTTAAGSVRQTTTTMAVYNGNTRFRHCYRVGFALFFGYFPNRICITIFLTVIVSKTIKTVGFQTCTRSHRAHRLAHGNCHAHGEFFLPFSRFAVRYPYVCPVGDARVDVFCASKHFICIGDTFRIVRETGFMCISAKSSRFAIWVRPNGHSILSDM